MKWVQRHLGWKLFTSYLVVILVGVISLALTAEIHAPTALNRHLDNMEAMIGGNMAGMMADLLTSFQTAINEVLLVATSLAMLTAILVSSFVTRRIIRPIQAMQKASGRIASGHYDERVPVNGDDELSELARSFNQMAHTLAQTEERRRQLIGDVAHELRTPLSSLKSVTEGLLDGVLPAEPHTFLDMQRELGRLQRLVQDLEELSKAESGQVPLELDVINPVEFVQRAIERLNTQFEDKNIQLIRELPSDLPSITVDPARMTQVMLNLLGNALQYTPEGGRVTIRAWSEEKHVHITVHDTGIGIAPAHLSHLFERFYRVDKSRSRIGGGSGIGLTISKHLVEAQKGSLAAASPGPGLGSTFTLTLPITN